MMPCYQCDAYGLAEFVHIDDINHVRDGFSLLCPVCECPGRLKEELNAICNEDDDEEDE
jgi:hypothetical protein